jgi:hypothetical protein
MSNFERDHFTRYPWLNVAGIAAIVGWVALCLAMGWV